MKITKDTKFYFEALGCYTVTLKDVPSGVRQQILQNQKLAELAKKHHDSCPERWCHCKSIEFDDILGGSE